MAADDGKQVTTGAAVTAPPPASGAPSQKSDASTAEARRKRYHELRTRIGTSKLKVVGEPGIHYFWAEKEDSNEMARLDLVGYSIVREPNAADVMKGKAKPKIQANGLRDDGTYQLGDVILVQCPEETYEFMMLDVEERHEQLARAAQDDFVTEAQLAGVPTFKTSKG